MSDLPTSIEVRNLTKLYGKTKAIDNLSFSVTTGEVVGFLGPNGAGKSTTLRILCGLMPATSGAANILGIPIALYPEKIKKLVAFMPENNPLPEEVRVIEYLNYRAQVKGLPRSERNRAIDRAMDLCDLSEPVKKKIIGNLSKGYRQRVGIADCLLGDPKIVIMDEPTIGLDPHQILGIRELIKNLRGKITILISSHILPEIEHSCDKAIIINRGHIVAEGTSESLREEFIPFVKYRLSVRGIKEKILNKINQIDPTSQLEGISNPDNEGFYDIELKTEKDRLLGNHLINELHNYSDTQIREITFHQPTLEDVFIAATQPTLSHARKGIKTLAIEHITV